MAGKRGGAPRRSGKIDWVFDELPPSGARRGGDPSEHVFEHDTSTFVREAIQNSNDQARAAADMAFRFIELTGSKLDSFFDALSWPSLRRHLAAERGSRLGRRLSGCLEQIERSGRLLLLRIEDRHTVGLVGDELEGNSHFRALCKDTLYSHKETESAGGSYGLGKSVLWNFSGISTVLFNSNLNRSQEGTHASPRLIGRAELPSHEVDQQWFSGSGWFGERVEADRGSRAESVWGETATERAKRLGLTRSCTTGTSILILGFREPSADTEPSLDDLIRQMHRAAAENFWPAMILAHRMLRVGFEVEGRAEREPDWIDCAIISELAPFLECARVEHALGGELRSPGDIVAREIEVRIPARLDRSRPKVIGRALLVVRLAEEECRDRLVSNVALYRGSGMVTRYWDRKNISIGVRPFHAIVRAGRARSLEHEIEDDDLEAFLRAAEPPGHDQWKSMPALKDTYQRGYKTALDDLHDEITRHLRELVARRPVQGDTGPDLLRKKFPIGGRGSPGGAPSAFHFSELEASFTGERWFFHGSVRPTQRGGAWEASIRMFALGEDGSHIAEIEIESIELATERAGTIWRDDAPVICAAAGLPAVTFSGTSVEIPDRAGTQPELALEVTGRIYAGDAP